MKIFQKIRKKNFCLKKKNGQGGGGNAAFFPVKSDTTFHWVLMCWWGCCVQKINLVFEGNHSGALNKEKRGKKILMCGVGVGNVKRKTVAKKRKAYKGKENEKSEKKSM